MLKILKKIAGSKSGLREYEKRESYYQALLRSNLPELLSFDETHWEKAKAPILKDFSFPDFPTEIHRNDIMFHYHLLQVEGDIMAALYSHFAVGARFVKALEELLGEVGSTPSDILDYGSGYGRVSRFLPLVWPQASITVSEVKAEALEFQKRFGFKSLPHTQAPASFEAGEYDLILALSVFSHLPLTGFKAWLGKLTQHLSPGGRLIFSFNPLNEKHNSTGFRYVPNSEDLHFPHIGDANFNTGDYGHAWLSRSLISAVVDPSSYELTFLNNRLTAGQECVLVRRKA